MPEDDMRRRLAQALLTGHHTQLPGSQELAFQTTMQASPWWGQFQQRFGETPNLNDPMYDYRGAYKAGVGPEPYEPDGGFYHWPSTTPDGTPLKAPSHPTAWAEEFMQRSGGQDPFEMGIEDAGTAAMWLRLNQR